MIDILESYSETNINNEKINVAEIKEVPLINKNKEPTPVI